MVKFSKILIIDDDVLTCHYIQVSLNKKGYQVDYLSSGENVLQHIQSEKYNLIFLDIKMPKIEGHEVLKLIRENYSLLELPVIMLSSNSEKIDVIQSFKLGANDYITKPASVDIVIARTQTQLTLAKYHKEVIRKKELEAVHSMVVTYSHEISNPLCIAIGLAEKFKSKDTEPKRVMQILEALNRIKKILIKIRSITTDTNQTLEFTQYVDGQKSKMLKLKS